MAQKDFSAADTLGNGALEGGLNGLRYKWNKTQSCVMEACGLERAGC